MEITVEVLNKYIEDFTNQKQSLTTQVHAVSGALQILEMLKKQLADVGQDDPSI